MNVQLHSTTKTVELVIDGVAVPARLWEGHTASGIPVHAYITRIAVDRQQDTTQFEAELQECRPPSADVDRAIPMRMIL